jgi:hypothetical protein
MFWTLDSTSVDCKKYPMGTPVTLPARIIEPHLNYSRRDDMNDAPAIRCSASCLPEKASLHRCFAILTPAGTRGERHE